MNEKFPSIFILSSHNSIVTSSYTPTPEPDYMEAALITILQVFAIVALLLKT